MQVDSEHNITFPGVVVLDSATKADDALAGNVVVAASHGGMYPAYLAAAAGVRGAIFNNAGVGKEGAGICGLPYLEQLGKPAAAVAHDSARIGIGEEMLRCGIIAQCNEPARQLGVRPGMSCAEAARLMTKAAYAEVKPQPYAEARTQIIDGDLEVRAVDSASLVFPEDIGKIVATGSHGGLVGGNPQAALKYDALAALFNDAGFGKAHAGIGRLAALDRRMIAAATVAADSARIGDGRSTYEDGVLSAVNQTASDLGIRAGMSAKQFAAMVTKESHRLLSERFDDKSC